MRPVIALLTDFGAGDWFVGSMKAVILSRAPDCTIVDLCHAIEPGAVGQAAWILEHTFAEFPTSTVFCAVVDPGVGTERRAIAACCGGYFFVAPDNGLLTGVKRRLTADEVGRSPASWHCRVITNENWMRPMVSHTFHGRDIFAPAAAQAALEQSIEKAGAIIADPVEIELPTARLSPDGNIDGQIIYFDRFGNAITTIHRPDAYAVISETAAKPPTWQVEIGDLQIERICSTFADVAPGECMAYWGSLGTLEIAVRNGNAREQLSLRLNQRVGLNRKI